MTGLEPTRLSTLDPKSSAATSYATSALWWSVILISECKDSKKYSITNIFCKNFYFICYFFVLLIKRGAFAHFHRVLALLFLRQRRLPLRYQQRVLWVSLLLVLEVFPLRVVLLVQVLLSLLPQRW